MSVAAPTLWQRLCHTRMRDALRGRFDARLDWRAVIANAELPDALKAVVSEVVRRTYLWRSEKVEVAMELIAHFQDGLEAGDSPEELVRNFGDPQRTARLIRRAKKRGRPLLWHVARVAALVLLALAAAYLAIGLYMLTGQPSIRVDYVSLITQHAAAVPEEERAWPLYRQALLTMGAPEQAQALYDFGQTRPGDAAWAETEQFLLAHAGALQTMRDAANRPGLGFVPSPSKTEFAPQDRELFGWSAGQASMDNAIDRGLDDRWVMATLLPHLSLLRSSATLLAVDARRAALAGDADTAHANIRALIGISSHLQEIPFMVNVLSAAAVQQFAFETVRELMAENQELWSNDQLHRLAHQIAAAKIDWRGAFEGERSTFYDVMQRVYTDDGQGDGVLALQGSSDQNDVFDIIETISQSPVGGSTTSNYAVAALALPAANFIIASRKGTTEAYERLLSMSRNSIDAPLWQSEASWLRDEIRKLESEPLGQWRYLFISMLFPAYESLQYTVNQVEGQREGVLLGLALELYRREHGEWPAALEELSPRWLPQVPIDRINGGPLGYRIVGDRPVVYSLGVDSDDDGGRLPKYIEERDHFYNVGPPYEVPPNAVEGMLEQYDGDWVIWSTATRERSAHVDEE